MLESLNNKWRVRGRTQFRWVLLFFTFPTVNSNRFPNLWRWVRFHVSLDVRQVYTYTAGCMCLTWGPAKAPVVPSGSKERGYCVWQDMTWPRDTGRALLLSWITCWSQCCTLCVYRAKPFSSMMAVHSEEEGCAVFTHGWMFRLFDRWRTARCVCVCLCACTRLSYSTLQLC